MSGPINVLAHSSPLCPVCRVPYADLLAAPTDVEAVDHLTGHGRREVAFALLVSEGHRLVAQGAADAVVARAGQLAAHLDQVADEQRPAVVGGDGF